MAERRILFIINDFERIEWGKESQILLACIYLNLSMLYAYYAAILRRIPVISKYF
jgi:hypothetical protein